MSDLMSKAMAKYNTDKIKVLQKKNANVISILEYEDLKVAVTGGYNYTPCLSAALTDAKSSKSIVELPSGNIILSPINRNDINGVTIRGAGKGLTTITKINTSGHDHLFRIRDCDNVTLQGFTVDCTGVSYEGAVYFGGMRNSIIKDVSVKNSEYTSIIIAGQGVSGGTRSAYDNKVIDCEVVGQRAYHPTGTSPFIAGDSALRTTFENCTVIDCVGDAYDSDNAPYTRFINCKAFSTGVRTPYVAFWAEGEQDVKNHYVTWENCYAENYTGAFSISEKVKGTILNGEANNCQKAVVGLNNEYRIFVKGFKAFNCGYGIENTDTAGIFSFTNCATLENLVTEDSVAKNSFCNYSATANTNKQTTISDSVFDKQVQVSYGDTGSRNVKLKNVTLTNTSVKYYNANNTRLKIEDCDFIDSVVSGTRIKKNSVRNSLFTDSTALLVAISANGDTYNTYYENCEFEGHLNVHSNATPVGDNNVYTNIVNTAPSKVYAATTINGAGGAVGFTPSLSKGFYQKVQFTSTTAFTFSNPTNALIGSELVLQVSNGNTSTAVTPAFGSAYKMNISPVNLTVGKKSIYRFVTDDGTTWYLTGCTENI